MAYFPGISPFGDRKSSSSLVFEELVPPSAWTEDQTCHYLLVDLPGFKKQELKLQIDNQTRIVVSGERQVSENKYERFEQKFELPNNADIEKITGKLDSEILYISVPKKVEQEHQEIKHGSMHGGETGAFDPAPAPAPSPSPHPISEVDEDTNEDDDDGNDDDEDNGDKKSDAYANADERESKNENKYGGGKELERKKHESDSDEDWGKEVDLFLRVAIEKLKKNKGIVVTAIFAFSLGVLVTQKFQSNELMESS